MFYEYVNVLAQHFPNCGSLPGVRSPTPSRWVAKVSIKLKTAYKGAATSRPMLSIATKLFNAYTATCTHTLVHTRSFAALIYYYFGEWFWDFVSVGYNLK